MEITYCTLTIASTFTPRFSLTGLPDTDTSFDLLTIASTFTPRFSLRAMGAPSFEARNAYDRLHFHPPIFTVRIPGILALSYVLRSPPLSPPDFHTWEAFRDLSKSILTIASTFTPRFSRFTSSVTPLSGCHLRSPPLSPPDFHLLKKNQKDRLKPSYDRLHFHPPIFTSKTFCYGDRNFTYDRLHFHPPIFTPSPTNQA